MRVALDQPRGRELDDGLADRRHAQAEVLRYLALADHLARPIETGLDRVADALGCDLALGRVLRHGFTDFNLWHAPLARKP